MVVSTTGEGDPPETAEKFWRRLKKKTLPNDHLAHLNYALLALGDSNYTSFCQNGKNFDKRLEGLGAKRFYPTAHADDAVGLEVVVEPWIEGLWPALKRQLELEGVTESCNGDVCEVDGTEEKLITGSDSARRETDSEQKDISRGTISGVEDRSSDSAVRTNGSTSLANGDSQDGGETDLTSSAKTDKQKDISRGTISGVEDRSSDSAVRTNGSTSLANGDSQDGGQTDLTSAAKTDAASKHKEEESGESRMGGGPSSERPVVVRDVKAEPHTPQISGGDTLNNSSRPIPEESLTFSKPPLCNVSLTLPLNPPPFLEITFKEDESLHVRELPLQYGAVFPSAASPVTMATVSRATKLTSRDAVKTTLQLELQLPDDESTSFQPGDSFGVICPNNTDEVNRLISRLEVSSKADTPFTLKLEAGTRKRKASVPEFVPVPATLRLALTQCYDIRTPPKKAFVRMLSEHTSKEGEKRRLQELCSKEGAADYNKFIRKDHLSLSDILEAFPSCLPPVQRILENLTRLLPRPYSVANSPLGSCNMIRFVFNVLKFPSTERKKAQEGLCSGWLNKITTSFQEDISNNSGLSDVNVKKLKIEGKPKVYTSFFRTSTKFHLPEDVSKPVIMIGPGTGVAPFMGFMEHRHYMKEKRPAEQTFGKMWLFYGCRHKERDFLYRDRINSFFQEGILSKLTIAFSRDEDDVSGPKCRYVQDLMRTHKKELADLVMNQEAVIYVCGDANGMAKQVMEAWTEILCEYTGKSIFEVSVLLATLREEERYLQDIWT
ncbi:putative methionine synthase reductase isoform X2 [Apostichopus japonicus]|uniref:Methionine synthase reductase n=1 Tax=Stichopus japonicus TaxID=307972 RepID=A0A2G8KKH1_STIJA|nr:putative methionine synthase reductase isoform X2 [Apostichopus japonicus]